MSVHVPIIGDFYHVTYRDGTRTYMRVEAIGTTRGRYRVLYIDHQSKKPTTKWVFWPHGADRTPEAEIPTQLR